MEITKREIIVSIIIISVMLILGLFISEKILDSQLEKNDMYNKSVKIDNQELFQYGMNTNIGNAFVYGELKTVDPVTYPEIGGEYMTIKKVTEEWTMHEREVDDYNSKGEKTGSHIEYYWTWDEIKSDYKNCETISFLSIEFPYGKIYSPYKDYIKTIDDKYDSDIRYVYYGSKTEYVGTIFSNLKDKTINNSSFYNGMNIEETIEYLESGVGLFIFKVFWFLLTVGFVIGFYYLDNDWLENKIRRRY